MKRMLALIFCISLAIPDVRALCWKKYSTVAGALSILGYCAYRVARCTLFKKRRIPARQIGTTHPYASAPFQPNSLSPLTPNDPFADAFKYQGEEVLYIGAGTASDTDTYQACPLALENAAGKEKMKCACINVDPRWNRHIIESELELRLNQQNHKPTVTFIQEPLTKDHIPFISEHIKKVLENKGKVFLSSGVGPVIPYLAELFNTYSPAYPQQIALTESRGLWNNGATFTWYSREILFRRLTKSTITQNTFGIACSNIEKAQSIVGMTPATIDLPKSLEQYQKDVSEKVFPNSYPYKNPRRYINDPWSYREQEPSSVNAHS